MRKSEFKKMMRKENEAFKKYYMYEVIISVIIILAIIINVLSISKNLPSANLISILSIIIAAPLIIIDMKNDLEIKKMYQYYLKEDKIPEYKDKTKSLKGLLILSIVIILINGAILIKNIFGNDNQDIRKIQSTLEITSNTGKVIKTQYESFDGFKIKIPTEFKIMSDELVNIKYPNGNPPSLVYTNDRTTINIVLVLNDVNIKNSEIEEYVKSMESLYKDYADNIIINFFERNNYKVGEIEFITHAEDTDIYNHIMVFSIDEKLRLINFNCTKDLMSEWKDIGDFIIDSIIFE